MNENPNNPVHPAEELAHIRNTRGLSKLVGFTERQFQHIDSWLDEQVSYRKIAEWCRTEWQREVPHMTIARYAKRRTALVLAADLDESKEAAAEISRYAATGDASFSTNTLELLEQKAFDLAAVYQRDSDAADLETIKQLTSIINKARNTKIRERHATVQELKLQLRREELALKRELQHARLARALNPNLPDNSRDDLAPTEAATSVKNHGRGAFHPRPTSNSRDAMGSTDAAPADQNATKGETLSASSASSASKPKIETPASVDRFPTPNPLPYDIYLKNCAYTEKLLAGLVDPITGEELPDPNEAPTEAPTPENLSTANSQPSTSESTSLQNGDPQ